MRKEDIKNYTMDRRQDDRKVKQTQTKNSQESRIFVLCVKDKVICQDNHGKEKSTEKSKMRGKKRTSRKIIRLNARMFLIRFTPLHPCI